mgnify:FL=1
MPGGFRKVLEISRALIDHCNPKNIDIIKIGAQLTLCTIGGLYRNPWDGDYQESTYQVGSILNRRYKKQKEGNNEPNLKLTSTHFLREEMEVYHGNLPEARNIGYDFYASSYDLKESIKLPLKLGFYEDLLIGIAYAEAFIATQSSDKARHGSKIRELVFKGTNYETELPLYQLIIIPLLKSQYNYIAEITQGIAKTLEGKEYMYPQIIVSSSAISTWFANHLHFPSGGEREDLEFPKYINKSDKTGLDFFVGYVSAKGRIMKDNSVKITSTKKIFLDSLLEVANKNGIAASVRQAQTGTMAIGNKDEYALRIGKHGIEAMYNEKLMYNPAHLISYLLNQKR